MRAGTPISWALRSWYTLNNASRKATPGVQDRTGPMNAPESQPRPGQLTGAQWLIAIALILSVACFYFASLRPGHVWGDDFAQYIQHASNLANRRPFAES